MQLCSWHVDRHTRTVYSNDAQQILCFIQIIQHAFSKPHCSERRSLLSENMSYEPTAVTHQCETSTASVLSGSNPEGDWGLYPRVGFGRTFRFSHRKYISLGLRNKKRLVRVTDLHHGLGEKHTLSQHMSQICFWKKGWFHPCAGLLPTHHQIVLPVTVVTTQGCSVF